jgi:hypothetical protein
MTTNKNEHLKEETLLTNTGVSVEFIGKKALWERQRAGRPKEKTPAHIALEKSITSIENPPD